MEEIKDESDSEIDSNAPYYLRSKRRRLSTEYSEPCTSKDTSPRKRKNPILHMPTEIIQKVLNFLNYNDLSESVRLINHRFKILAEDILNRSFKMFDQNLKALTRSTYESIQSTQDDNEIRCLLKLLNMLEIVVFQHNVVTATTWRYIYNPYYRTIDCCMYGGKLLDTFNLFIWKFTHVPRQLCAPSLHRDYCQPPEVTEIIELSKNFCLHFEKLSEDPDNNNLFRCGSKILDLLDCALFANRNILYEKAVDDFFTAKYCYYFSNSWFVALDLPNTKQMPWGQKQRLMQMRLRRIVLAHTDMFMTQNHCERERVLRMDQNSLPATPGNSVYTGYGDVYTTFFYYGVMNDGAYISKFHSEDDDDDDFNDEDDEVAANPIEQIPILDENADDSDGSILFRVPFLGVRIDITLKCPLTHAPKRFLDDTNTAVLESSSPQKICCEINSKQTSTKFTRIRSPVKSPQKNKITLNMNFECYGASYPRLPTKYFYSAKQSEK